MIIVSLIVLIASLAIGTTVFLDRSFLELSNRVNWPDRDLYSGVAEVQAEKCRLFSEIKGACEDSVVDETTGLVYFACADVETRKKWYPPCNWWDKEGVVKRDTFHVYDPEADTFEELDLDYSGEFVSHGLSILVDPSDSERRLVFAINHQSTGSVVSVFSLDKSKKMTFIGDIEDGKMYSPNSVSVFPEADGSYGLLYTNDHLFTKGFLRDVEEVYGPFIWGHIGYFNIDITGNKVSKEYSTRVAVDSSCPNGLVQVSDTNEFLATDTRMGSLKRYIWNYGLKQLILLDSIPLGVGLDNVRIIPGTQDAVLAGFPTMPQLGYKFSHMDDDKYETETVALRINRADNYTTPVVLHKSDGQFGIQVVTTFNYLDNYGKLLGSSVVDGGVLVCDI